MAEQFRNDGVDEYTVEKWIRQEMEQDEFERLSGTTDPEALKEWETWPEDKRQLFLNKGMRSYDDLDLA